MRKSRRTAAVTCIALVVLAAFLPLGGALEWLIVTPVFTVLPFCTSTSVHRAVPSCDEQPVALLAIVESRGPPSHSSLS